MGSPDQPLEILSTTVPGMTEEERRRYARVVFPSREEQRTTLNPLNEPGRWINSYWRKLSDPVEDAWNEPEWALPKTALASLTTPFNILPAAITTTLGYDKAANLWEASEKYGEEKELSTKARWGLQGLALGADFFLGGPTDPLRMVSAKPSLMWKTAEQMLKEAPEVAGLRKAEKLGETAKIYRTGAEVTEENVRAYVAPKMISDGLANTFDEARLITKDHPGIQKTYGDYDIWEHYYGGKKYTPVQTQKGAKSMEDFQKESRALSYETLAEKHSQLPTELLKNPATPLAEKLEALANHEEYIVRAVMDGAPTLRVHLPIGTSFAQIAKNFQEGIKTPIPSPVRAVGKGIKNIFASWKDLPGMRTPVGDAYDKNTVIGFSKYVTGSGYRGHVTSSYHPDRMNIMEAEQFILQEQTPWRKDPEKIAGIGKGKGGRLGKRRDSQGVIHKRKDMIEYATSEVQSVPDHMGVEHLRNIRDTYKLIEEGMAANPEGVFASEAYQVTEGRETLDNIIEAIEDIVDNGRDPATIPDELKGLYDGIMNPHVHEFRINRLLSTTKKQFETIKASQRLYHTALQVASKGSGIPGDLPKSLLQATRASGVYDDLPKLLTEAMNNYQTIMGMTVSYNFALQNRETLRDLARASEEISNFSTLNHEMIRDMLVGQSAAEVDAVTTMAAMLREKTGRKLLGKMANVPVTMGVKRERNLVKAMGIDAGDVEVEIARPLNSLEGARNWATPVPDEMKNGKLIKKGRSLSDINEERNYMVTAIGKRLSSLATKGRIEIQDANNVMSFLSTLDNESFGNLIFSFQDLAQAKSVMSFESALLDRFLTPTKKAMEGMEKILSQEHGIERRQLSNKFASMQAKYSARKDPFGLIQEMMKPGGWVDEVNSLIKKIFRKAGFSSDAIERFQKYQENSSTVKPLAEEHGIEFSKKTIVATAEKINPAMAGKISKQTESRLNEAVGDYVQYYYTEKQFTPRELSELRQLMAQGGQTRPAQAAKIRQLQISERKISDSISSLTELFGDRATAEKYAEEVRKKVSEYTEGLYKEEVRLKLAKLYRKNYVPYRLSGDPNDKAALRELIMGETAANKLSSSDRARIVQSFGPAEHRHFYDAAGLQDFINEVNKARVAKGKSALNVTLESNISAIIADRKKSQLQALNNRLLIDTLEAAVPHQMRVIFGLSDEAKKVLSSVKGWKDVGEIIPALEGRFVRSELFDYLATYVPKYDQENKLYQLLKQYLNGMSRFNIQFSLVHMKNIASLAYVAGTNPKILYNVLSDGVRNQHKFLDTYPGAMNLMKRISLALEDSELYKRATRNGLTHFRGADQFSSVADNVKKSMSPSSRYRKVLEQGAFGTFLFDVMDRATKMATYEQFTKMGLPERMAADWTNHYLIDYTGKNLDPTFRKHMHAIFPFVSWRIGNALLHIPEMIENPRKYAMIYYLRDYFADSVLKTNPFVGDEYPEALKYTMPTPAYDTDGNQIFVAGDLPWETDIRLLNKAFLKNPSNPLLTVTELSKYVVDHSFYGGLLRDAMTPTKLRELKNKTFIETYLFPGEKKTPEIYNAFWGILPQAAQLERGIRGVIEKDSWADLTPFAYNFIVGRTIPVGASGKPARLNY